MSASGRIPPPCAATSGSRIARPARRGPALPGRTRSRRSGCPRTPRASGTPTRRDTLLGSRSLASLPRSCGSWDAGARGGTRWVVLVDDDTVLSPDNLVAVLGKYDLREMVYIRPSSESHSANTYFNHGMAFGGGGVAHSFPLAAALAGTLDVCIQRYPRLYGSDDRLHACITELGIPFRANMDSIRTRRCFTHDCVMLRDILHTALLCARRHADDSWMRSHIKSFMHIIEHISTAVWPIVPLSCMHSSSTEHFRLAQRKLLLKLDLIQGDGLARPSTPIGNF